MRSFLSRKSSSRIYAVIGLGMVLVILLVLGVLLTVNRLDGYIRVMYFGNSAPIGHLANIRSAETNVRRLQWKIFAHRNPGKTDEYAQEIEAKLDDIAREWQLYYPVGVSSKEESRLAEQIKQDLPELAGMARQALQLLETHSSEEVMTWYQQRVPFLDHLDQLLTQDINVNLDQAAQFANKSKVIFDKFLLITIALIVLVVVGGVAGIRMSLLWRKQRDAAEQKSREHLWLVDQVFNITMDGVIITDRLGKITKVNPAFTAMTGYTESEVLGQNPSLWSSGRQSSDFYADMWQSLKEEGQWKGKLWNRKKSGDLYLESLAITAISGLNESELHYAAVCSDITKQHAEQEFQGYLATHDPLTDLPNRLLFRERLTQAIARGQRSGAKVAILFLDLDHFKEINDRLGHPVGDGTLTTIASRLKACLRDVDTVARLGGDEFAIVLEDIHQLEQIAPITRKLLLSVGEPILVDEHWVSVTPSIGVSIYPEHGKTPELLVKCADQAMYEAKEAGKNAVRFYTQPEYAT
ncbi:diguanylate cyclase [Pseudomonas koreensis]|uniref:diguanylate cyclase domain-containing protein n=1 Tax=Pseudomonas koreensis TaxID=198620 RepID=UPI0021C934E8|nr:diguanylate cyclase [Pseudomonas koreensis]MCU0070110.1 diguanylate cyclase [Pseudomonas koreensis]